MNWEMLSSAGLVFLADQASKRLVVSHLAVGQAVRFGWLQIRHVPNRGRGQARLANWIVLLFFWGLAFAGITLAIQSGHFFQHPAAQLGLGAALGGAAGNIYDRCRRGVVIDFVDVGWWPVFNLADAAITVGAITALWLLC